MTSSRTSSAHSAAAILALAILALGMPGGSVRADTKQEIAQVEARLEAIADKLEAQAAQVDRLEAEAGAIAARISAVQAEIESTKQEIAVLRREIAAAERRMLALQRQLDGRAREAYQNGPGTAVELVLGSTSFSDFASRMEFVDQAAESDRDLFERVTNIRNELRHKELDLVRAERTLQAQRADLAADQEAIQAKLASAARTVRQMEGERAEAERLLKRLRDRRARELAAARLEAARRAEEARRAARAAEQAVGGEVPDAGGGGSGDGPFYVCPVDPPRAYSNDYGAPRSGGRTHQGNDIFAPYGTPIRATFPGTAVERSNSLGGLSVIVYGSRGFTYNAHLSRLGTLGRVSTGTIIGYVGDSGNAQGTSPHNHFEWHPGNGGAVNPYPYLNEVC